MLATYLFELLEKISGVRLAIVIEEHIQIVDLLKIKKHHTFECIKFLTIYIQLLDLCQNINRLIYCEWILIA